MPRTSVLITVLAMAVAVAGLAYIHGSREDHNDAVTAPSPASTPIAKEPMPVAADVPSEAALDTATSSAPLPTHPITTSDSITRWITDTTSLDARTRAAAIAALANAPKEQAAPALKRVLETGEPQVDRQIALRSLYTIAVNDGDQDGMVRDVIRQAIYHSDDEGVTQTAQALLEDIEAEFAQRAANPTN